MRSGRRGGPCSTPRRMARPWELYAARGEPAEMAWALGAWYGARRVAGTRRMPSRRCLRRCSAASMPTWCSRQPSRVCRRGAAGITRFLVEQITCARDGGSSSVCRWRCARRSWPRLGTPALRRTSFAPGACCSARATSPRREPSLSRRRREAVQSPLADGARFGIGGHGLGAAGEGHGTTELTDVLLTPEPASPPARAACSFSGARRPQHSVEGGGSAPASPLFNWPSGRLRRALWRFAEARDAALARLVPNDADLPRSTPATTPATPTRRSAARCRPRCGCARSGAATFRAGPARGTGAALPERRARRPPCLAGRDRTGCARRRGAR